MITTNYKVTILLAAHNRAHLIEETLDSIVAQTYKNWECIIVDDHSEDNTREVVRDYEKKDSRFSYYLKTEKYKKGLSGTRNCSLDLAKERGAEYVQFFDDDDIMHPEKIEIQILPFQDNSSLGFTVCQYLGFSDRKEIDFNSMISDIPINSNNLANDFLFSRIRINSAGPLFKLKLFKSEIFDEELRYGEEWELFNRIFFKYQPEFVSINKCLFYYRSHNNSITGKTETQPEKIGTQIIIIQKLWNFLKKNDLLTDVNITYFLNHFLFQYNNRESIIDIKCYLKKEGKLPVIEKYKYELLIFVHNFYLRVMKFLLFRIKF
ncbi:glycosyltransferase family 2 protein [Salegentibacter salarius]|uniref:Glycosyltransferase 2-like domain-containing protein n=1 Tax=Salegentibacter salarius TaxID=435906 RepID=A0A2N0TQ91_9FLAO|nr:glycosyltransferase family 2 protein [Salegentibacter salarius]OEY71660.1 hypothetical protein BHS39_04680 [Salegentibacter salarius]PKD16909.1 hypothetical protein APR40_04680 [Salegentibacter salarius]SLJ90808.1 Glycosyltransferase involved in cell wall bisynthesis [Salegentibacter salarius]